MLERLRHPYGVAALLSLLVWLVVAWRSGPPSVRPDDDPLEVFSGARAHAELVRLLGDESPHPMGSDANAAVRQRVVGRLRELGLSPEVQKSWQCNSRGACGYVENVVAVIEGGRDAVMLSVHYDSVPAGPGASDDGAGVAALLEIARALVDDQSPHNTIVLLVNDGEEVGLLGAKAFMESHPLASRIRAVVNVEARGSRGASLMFETSGNSGPLAEHLRALPRPQTSSLFSAVYEQLPNDTDLTVYRQHEVAGYNFAYIGDVAHYHTPLDDLEHLDRGSLQHHGDNALALTRSLAAADLNRLDDEREAVWFDWLGIGVVVWSPATGTFLAVLGTLALVIAGTLLARRERRRYQRGVLLGALTMLLLPALTVAGGFVALTLPASRGDARLWWQAFPHLPLFALVFVAAGVLLQLSRWLSPFGMWTRFLGVWIVWAPAAIGLALAFPPASYLFVLPILAAGSTAAVALALPRRWTSRARRTLVCVPAFVAMVMWTSILFGLGDAIGFFVHSAIAIVLGIALTPLLPLCGDAGSAAPDKSRGLTRVRHLLWGAAMGLACGVATWLLPAATQAQPLRASVVHLQDDATGELWIDHSFGMPPAAVVALGFGKPQTPPLPWMGYESAAAMAADRIDVARPDLVRAGSWQGSPEYRLRSRRRSRVTAIMIPPDVTGRLYLERQPAPTHRIVAGRYAGHQLAVCLSTPDEGARVSLVGADARSRVLVADVVSGLPTVAEEVVAARHPTGVGSQHGDVSIVIATAALTP